MKEESLTVVSIIIAIAIPSFLIAVALLVRALYIEENSDEEDAAIVENNVDYPEFNNN